jgi:hypothetical protein
MAAFTTIAAGVGLAATVGSTAMSFSNASKQGKLAAQAKAAADASMQKAKQALEINYQKEQAVKKEPYELEREAALAAGAQAIEAGVEAGQAAPTAGRVMLAQQDQQASIQGRMGQEMTAIDKSIINESSRLRDVGVQIDMEEAAGANLAARDAEEAQAKATAEGWQGVTRAVGQAASFVPLFSKNASAGQTDRLMDQAERRGMSSTDYQNKIAGLGKVGNIDYGTVKGMDSNQFESFMQGVPANDIRNIRRDTLGFEGFNPFSIGTYDSQHIFGRK